MQFDNPLIVQSDRTLLLDVHAPRAAECRNALIPFAELERSPEHLHTYRLTALSLWNASGAGFKPEQAIGVLKEFARYDVPQSVEQWILETAGRFGKLRLVQGPKIEVPLTAANSEGEKDSKQVTEEYLYLVTESSLVYREIAACSVGKKMLTECQYEEPAGISEDKKVKVSENEKRNCFMLLSLIHI